MRKALWDSMLDADMNARYWSYLSRRYYIRDKYSKIFLAIMSSGTVATWGFWSQIEWLWKLLSGISALLAIALPLLNWPKMISSMVACKQYWTEIKTEYDLTWLDFEKGKPEQEIENEFRKLKMKEVKATEKETNLPKNNKLLWKCWNEVLKSRGIT